ncbi:phosphatidate cytidylyltransferase [Micromonospora sp. SH-82]|uniref:phosphatidate cytidylyltransferase n=1 Tax=Micromonospora sp. SH-82 TaxID=3132938 RepID=UPI003EC14BF1
MSPLDPYSGTESRGWDRPEPGPGLPWPDRDMEPGPSPLAARQPGPLPGRYAEPADRETPTDPYGARPVPATGRPESGTPAGDRNDVPATDPGVSSAVGAAGPATPTPAPGTGLGRPSASGPAQPPVDERPTAQFAAIRPEPEPGSDPDPQEPSDRRGPGRRRASADRPATQQPRPNRAGRNLPAAIGVGLALGALILVPLFTYPPAFLPVIAAAVGVGVWEMSRAVRRVGARPPTVPLVAGSVLTIVLAWWAGPDALTLGLLVTIVGATIWRLGDGFKGLKPDLVAIAMIAVYVPFLAGFAAMLAAVPDDGHWRVLVTLVAVVLSDTGGYATGVSFGRHKMAPSISPSKSWEGFAGSVLAAAAGSAVLIWLLFDVAPWWGALFGVAVSGAAVLGDLAESMIKRDIGIKDMSTLLPGHGGLMDRLDSILFAVPAAYLILAVFVPVVS